MINDPLRSIMEQRRENKSASDEQYKVQSRERLKRIAVSKIKTTMIAAIAAVENTFGELWGQGVHRSKLTPDQLRMLELKERMRTEILNKGNAQIRAISSEIDQYDISWGRYQYNLREDAGTVFGLREDGSARRARYGYNEDGSIRVRENDR